VRPQSTGRGSIVGMMRRGMETTVSSSIIMDGSAVYLPKWAPMSHHSSPINPFYRQLRESSSHGFQFCFINPGRDGFINIENKIDYNSNLIENLKLTSRARGESDIKRRWKINDGITGTQTCRVRTVDQSSLVRWDH
jgi:hypothetical protein